jgi:undecaprenyl-diphosphatase
MLDGSGKGIRRLSDVVNCYGRFALGVGFAALALLAAISHRWLLTVEGPLAERIRGESLTGLFGAISFIGGTEVAIVAALALALITWRRCQTFALVYPGTLLVGALVNIVLKQLIGRPRPPVPSTGVALASFPSGHTLQATLLLGLLPLAIYLLVGRRWAFRLAVVASAGGIVAVGLSRVYLEAHWPTDIVGGVLVGAGLILVAEWVLRHPRSHGDCDCVLAVA